MQETPKTYEAASGKMTFRYMSGSSSDDPARFVAVSSDSGSLEQVILGADMGTHWNVYSCAVDGTYVLLYQLSQTGEKDTRYSGKEEYQCSIASDKDGKVDFIAVTDKREENPAEAINQCPPGKQCFLYKVETTWVDTNNDELILNEEERKKIEERQESANSYQRQKSAERAIAEREMEALIKDCREGSQYACDAVKAITR